jgi:flagellar hook-associated protein 3 FlgL
MRVSSTQYHITVNASLQNSNAQLEKLMGQMSTGNRLTRPSDDPIAHVRISRLQREEASIAQYKDNIGALSSRMSQSETIMSSINADLLSARDLLVWALDGGNSGEDLGAMATNLASLRDALYAGSLTKDQEGTYLFSGTLSKTATVLYDATAPAGSRYTVGGNAEQQQVVVGNGLTQPANVTLGDEMSAMLNALDKAADAIQGGTTTANDPATRTVLLGAMGGVDTAMDQVSTKISKLGGVQNIIGTLSTDWNNLSTANKTAVLDYSQLDYSTAAVQLKTLVSAIEATQSAYGKVSKLSLFDAL